MSKNGFFSDIENLFIFVMKDILVPVKRFNTNQLSQNKEGNLGLHILHLYIVVYWYGSIWVYIYVYRPIPIDQNKNTGIGRKNKTEHHL